MVKFEKITIGTVIGIVAMLIALSAYFMPLYSMQLKIDSRFSSTETSTETNSNVTTNVTATGYVNVTGVGGSGYSQFIEISPTKFFVMNAPLNESGISVSVDVSVVITSALNISQSDIDSAKANITNSVKSNVTDSVRSNATNESFFKDLSKGMSLSDNVTMPAPLTLELVMTIVIVLGFVMGIFGVMRKPIKKRRSKFITSGIAVLIPVILILVVLMQIPMIISQVAPANSSGSSSSGSSDSGPDILDLFNKTAASPMSGEASVLLNSTNASQGSIGIKWGLGLGGYMFITACAIYFVAAIVLIIEGKKEGAAPVTTAPAQPKAEEKKKEEAAQAPAEPPKMTPIQPAPAQQPAKSPPPAAVPPRVPPKK